MLEQLTIDSFKPHLGEAYRIGVGETPLLEATLIDAYTWAKYAGGGEAATMGERLPFTLVFRGPIDRVLTQQIYRVEHEAIGAQEIFLVPIGPDAQGMRYEAVFT